MAKFLCDAWGRSSLEPNFNTKPQLAYETDAPESGDGAIYERFFNKSTCMVHRTTIATANGRTSVKTEVAWGAWANRATLAYGSAEDYPKEVEA